MNGRSVTILLLSHVVSTFWWIIFSIDIPDSIGETIILFFVLITLGLTVFLIFIIAIPAIGWIEDNWDK